MDSGHGANKYRANSDTHGKVHAINEDRNGIHIIQHDLDRKHRSNEEISLLLLLLLHLGGLDGFRIRDLEPLPIERIDEPVAKFCEGVASVFCHFCPHHGVVWDFWGWRQLTIIDDAVRLMEVDAVVTIRENMYIIVLYASEIQIIQ